MKQRLPIVLLAVAILFAIFAYFVFRDGSERDDTARTASIDVEAQEQAETGESSSDGTEGEAAKGVTVEEQAKQAESGEADEAVPADSGGEAPSFDIVRVEPTGELVVAGRAPAGSEVTLFDGESDLEKGTADLRGTWVVIPKDRLQPGTHELKLRAQLADGSLVWSRESAVVVVPGSEGVLAAGDEKAAETLRLAESVAGEAGLGGEASQSLVVVVPDDESLPARVLQRAVQEGNEGVVQGTLALDTIDYDEMGRAILAGRAPAGALIVVYLDNKAIAATRSGEDGRWLARPEDLVEPGLHNLRIDQVDEKGQVVARVETPFSRAVDVEQLAQVDAVVVQPGHSLWRIARRVYGKGIRYTVIYEANANQIRDPDLIYPGQIFSIPQSAQQ